MAEEKKSLYDRLGGAPAVRAAVIKFYGRIMMDPLLGPFFDPNNLESLKRSQIAFLTMALGGPHNYTGKNLRTAHARLVTQGLSDQHFDAVKQHLAETLGEMGVARDMINEALTIVETTRKDVLGR